MEASKYLQLVCGFQLTNQSLMRQLVESFFREASVQEQKLKFDISTTLGHSSQHNQMIDESSNPATVAALTAGLVVEDKVSAYTFNP